MKHFISNLSLKKKFHSIVFLCIILLASAAFCSIRLISGAYQKVLYQAVASSLSYSAQELDNRLMNAMTMGDMFLADTTIQQGLTTLKDSDNILQRSFAYKSLYGALNEYYFNFRKNSIDYMSLYQNDFSIHTHIQDSDALPDNIVSDLIARAEEAKGRTLWIPDYSKDYGLFMVKNLRRTEYLGLDSIGTLIVNLDIDGLIGGATDTSHSYEDSHYILYNQENVIFNSSGLETNTVSAFENYFDSEYGTVKRPDGSLFYVKGTIPDFEWGYVCLIPYGSIEDSLMTSLKICVAIIIAAAAIAALLSSALIDSVTKHFDNLILKMKCFAEGPGDEAPVSYDYSGRTDELGILHSRFDQMAETVNQLIKTNYLNEILIKEAQLKALESQMNPHFLYNTLESINWRAKAKGAKDIASMAECLGTLLRIMLDQKHKQVPLRTELELVRCYMTIQKYRYEDRLEYQVSVPEELLECDVLKLTLQPLVENAIRYGLEENTEGCRIQILARSDDTAIYIYVKNNGSSFEDDLLTKLKSHQVEPHGFGIGLLNISERMQLTYGEGFGLTLYNEDEQATARLSFPLNSLQKSDAKGESKC